MSTPSLPPTVPLDPPDLQQAHEQVQQRFRISKIAALGAFVILGICMGLLAWATLDGVAGVAFGVGTFALFLVFMVACMGISTAKENRYAGPASKGPSSFGQVVTSAPGHQVWESVNSALRELKFAPGRLTDPQTVVSTRSLSMASWGEKLTVRVVSTTDGRGLVTVWSRPAYPLQWLDYGRDRRYANAVLRAIPASTPVA